MAERIDDTKPILQALSASGFPFQTAVAAVVRGTGMYEVKEEVAWRHRDGSDKFLDIVATGKQVRVMLECKKTKDEQYVFLQPENSSETPEAEHLKGIFFSQVQDSTRRGSVR